MTLRNIIQQILLLTLVLWTLPSMAQDSEDTVEIVSESAIITFSLNGAYPVGWDIIDPEFVEPGESVPLIYKGADSKTFPYPFRLILDGPDGELTRFANTARYTHEELETDEGEVIHTFVSPVHQSGLKITKQWIPDRSPFVKHLNIVLEDEKLDTKIPFDNPAITFGAGLGEIPSSIGGLGDSMYTYVEAIGILNHDLTPFELQGDSSEDSHQTEVEVDRFPWLGVHNRYYAMFISDSMNQPLSAIVRIPIKKLSGIGLAPESMEYFPEVIVNMGVSNDPERNILFGWVYDVYAGPKDPNSLRQASDELEAVMYYNLPNWMRWLTFKLGALLNAINGVVHVWWVTLLVLVVIVRILLFPVAQKAIVMNAQMMADQAKLKPLIDAIKEKYKDPTLQYQKTMELYKEHGINPMAPMLGCVPVLLQLPILIAIFNLLGQEVKMQGATFLWVKDLSIPDQLFALPFTLPYFGSYFNLLPVLMSVTMVLTTNMGTPAEGDQKKSQMRSMIILAFIFFALFYSFPAGLVLYWMMSNIGQFIQQEVMTRRVNKA